jgi:4'-phosphopantetheinyl transferase
MTGTAPANVVVERTCAGCGQPHGRPLLPGTQLHASVTHSGDVVGVALTRTGPLGLDVEQVRPIDVHGVSRIALRDGEEVRDPAGFFTYWTRKEAVIKALGGGLAAPLAQIQVTGPDDPPGLLSAGSLQPQAHLVELRPKDSYRAALAVLTKHPIQVEERQW